MAATMTAPVAIMAQAAAPAASRRLSKAQPTFRAATVSNGIKTKAMMVWQPFNNKFFETFSFLPPLSDAEVGKQVDYITNNGWVPCLEFAAAENAYVSNENCVRFGGTPGVSANYVDNRYWTMWKLPMFGCTDSSQVLKEVQACTKTFPNAFVRLVAFDSNRQVQVAGLLVHRPASAKDFQAPDKRSV